MFTTNEDVAGTGDADGLADHYLTGPEEQPTLLSGSNPAGTGGREVDRYHRALPGDGESFVFSTSEDVPGTGDTDGETDVYLSAPGASGPAPSPPPASGGTADPPPGSGDRGDPSVPASRPSTSPAGSPLGDGIAPRFTRGVHLRGGHLRFTLSEAARVTITISQERTGRRVDGRCRAPSRRTRGARRCTRQVLVGRVRRDARAGANAVRFSGRVVPHRLRPGRFRVVAVARDAAGNVSRPDRARFRLRAAGA
jgi:hypothetical protein